MSIFIFCAYCYFFLAFAEKILISTQGLSNIARNRYQPTAQTIDTTCRVFKISPLELLIEKSDEKEEIIKNISLLLMSCSKTRLKKIYKIVAEFSKF